VVPSDAKTRRVEFPRAGTPLAGLFECFTGHLAVRRKDHLKFRARGRYGCEWLPIKKGCLYLVWRHGLRGQSGACPQKVLLRGRDLRAARKYLLSRARLIEAVIG
jgi:hypothetical protein